MHVLYFGLKRAFHATLKINRPLLDRHAITPARFDLLYVIHLERWGSLRQSKLRRVLGVARPTISRMVRSLETLGLLDATTGLWRRAPAAPLALRRGKERSCGGCCAG